MKKKIKKEVEVETSFCNICRKEIEKEPWNKDRIAIVRGLFKTNDFDAHERCLNKIIRNVFSKYI